MSLPAGVLTILVLMAVAAPLIARYDPSATNLSAQFQSPSPAHFFGTDELGRDLFSRVIYGARISLFIGGAAVTLAVLFGVPLGLLSGYFGRWVDIVIMRFIDFLLAVPAVLFAMGLIAILGRGTTNALIAVAVISVPSFARITRSSILTLKERDFVAAARAVGAGNGYIMFRTMLPNCAGPIIVQMAVTAAVAILLEAALSFLGLGTQPPTPSWGEMLSTGKSYLSEAPWYGLFPGIFLTITVLALDALGSALHGMLSGRDQSLNVTPQ